MQTVKCDTSLEHEIASQKKQRHERPGPFRRSKPRQLCAQARSANTRAECADCRGNDQDLLFGKCPVFVYRSKLPAVETFSLKVSSWFCTTRFALATFDLAWALICSRPCSRVGAFESPMQTSSQRVVGPAPPQRLN